MALEIIEVFGGPDWQRLAHALLGLGFLAAAIVCFYTMWRARLEPLFRRTLLAQGAFMSLAAVVRLTEAAGEGTALEATATAAEIACALTLLVALFYLRRIAPRLMAVLGARAALEQSLRGGPVGGDEVFRTLTETVPHLVWVAAPDGQRVYLSPRWAEYTGVPTEDCLGHNWVRALHPDDAEPASAAWLDAVAEGGGPYEREYRLRHGDEYRWSLARAVPMRNAGGQVMLWFGTCTDIEDLKRAQTAVSRLNQELERRVAERTRELERSNAELEQFAYVASHDLQEPLRMVSSYCQLIEHRYGDRLDADAHEFIRYAVDGAARMQKLINALLEYSRVNTRGRPAAAVSLAAALAVALDNLQVAIGEAGAEITFGEELEADRVMVLADEGQLVQLLQNLLSNALKFRGEAPARISVGARRRGDQWEVAVRDNGIGIDPQYAARIFEIFQRLHDRDRYPGTGIGLAICKRIVERLGGAIRVDSAPGAGATFTFTLSQGVDNEQAHGGVAG